MTDTRKDFEEFYKNEPLAGSECYDWCLQTWQACQQLNDKRIQQLLAVIAVKDKALKLMHEAFDDGDYKDGTESYAIQKCEDSLAIKQEDVELVEVSEIFATSNGTSMPMCGLLNLKAGEKLYKIQMKGK